MNVSMTSKKLSFRRLDPVVTNRIFSFREGFFLVPVSPPVHFEGVENRKSFLDGRYLNSIFQSGRFCEQHGCTAKYVHSYGARFSEVYVFLYCAPVYTCTWSSPA